MSDTHILAHLECYTRSYSYSELHPAIRVVGEFPGVHLASHRARNLVCRPGDSTKKGQKVEAVK
jgi:hypothetical protein